MVLGHLRSRLPPIFLAKANMASGLLPPNKLALGLGTETPEILEEKSLFSHSLQSASGSLIIYSTVVLAVFS